MSALKLRNSLVAWLLGVLCAVTLFDRGLAEWVALGLIVLAGIPHGAFDVRVAQRRWGNTFQARVAIVLGYLLSGIAMSALCLCWPAVGLGVFVAISVLHFGEGEGRIFGSRTGVAIGFSAILLPIALHPVEAGEYLSYFLAAQLFEGLLPTLRLLAAVTLLGGCCVSLRCIVNQRYTEHGWELLCCLMGMVLLSPLAGFAVWFIGRHSSQHLARCRAMFLPAAHWLGWDFVLISVAAISLIMPLAAWFDLSRIDELFAASIVLIAGLTLPHMIVTHGLEG
ncbi:MAG: hypothetical protein EBZ48_05105 [Proteobacteria bacterium]|nr:hypothetical protein [Pseudomonadota bacterium]